jgi:hypothetical protein
LGFKQSRINVKASRTTQKIVRMRRWHNGMPRFY